MRIYGAEAAVRHSCATDRWPIVEPTHPGDDFYRSSSESSSPCRNVSVAGSYTPNPAANSQ